MSTPTISIGFKNCMLRRGNRMKSYDGIAKIARTGPDYREKKFVVMDLDPLVFFDEDFEQIEQHLERTALPEILSLLSTAEKAAGLRPCEAERNDCPRR